MQSSNPTHEEETQHADLNSPLTQHAGPISSPALDTNNINPDPAPLPALPPSRLKAQTTTVDELIAEINRTPLFMTSLDSADGENVELDALRALAYEGTRAEIAQNFREQGSELVKLEKRYVEAREYYSKALAALKAPREQEEDVEIDEVAEEAKEREIEEACLVNRALCNLEMKNYRATTTDCLAALVLNPSNVKAHYRLATAYLALDKLPDAQAACSAGLAVSPTNAALRALSSRCEARRSVLKAEAQKRRAEEARKIAETEALRSALRQREIATTGGLRPSSNVTTPVSSGGGIPDDVSISLADPSDPSSVLTFPVQILYPAHAQSDFIREWREDEGLGVHLGYLLPVPWEGGEEYGGGAGSGKGSSVEAYIQTSTGGLLKVGKKVSLGNLLSDGRVKIVDGVVRIYVLPKEKAGTWIEEFKSRSQGGKEK